METLAPDADDLVYGPDGFPLDVFPPTWCVAEAVETAASAAEVFEPAERLLTAREAASYVGVHPNTIYAAAASERLRSRRVGRLVRFTIADLDAWTGGGTA